MSDPQKQALREALVRRTEDPAADLRARLAAGLALGRLGDPRLVTGTGDRYLLPPLIEVPGGSYTLGTDERIAADEAPAHRLEIAAFRLGRFPVSNAEWALFMAAGGYEEPRWWDTPAAAQWHAGRGTNEGARWRDRYWRRQYQSEPDILTRMRDHGRLSASDADAWAARLVLDDSTFERDLMARWPDGRCTEPAAWRDEAFNNPAQPVSGISWYEARAYCNWLSAQLRQPVRLPTEAEFEAATRGPNCRRFAWGPDFEVDRANTSESRVLRPSPIGAYPAGRTPEGLDDMTGNVYEWTSSRYGPEPDKPTFAYPYDPADGRESADAPADDLRVARGGSWAFDKQMARATNRGPVHPALRSDVGLRIVVGA